VDASPLDACAPSGEQRIIEIHADDFEYRTRGSKE
jgi:hypothetical protein